jgi:hypothetical protein
VTSADELAVISAIHEIRKVEPFYARGLPLTTDQVDRVVRSFRLDVFRMEMKGIALLSPWIEGDYYLALNSELARGATTNFVELHEVMHVIREDVREPTRMDFKGDYPIAERYCNVVALLGIMDVTIFDQGEDYTLIEIDSAIHFRDRGWHAYRKKQLAADVCAVRAALMREDGDEWGAAAVRTRTRRRWKTR